MVTKYKASTLPNKPPDGIFEGGRLAMYPAAPYQIGPTRKTLKNAGAPWGWDIVPHPAPPGKRPVPTLFTQGYSVWKSPEQDAAVDAVRTITSGEMMLEWGTLTGRDPARANLIEEHARRLNIPPDDPKAYPKLFNEYANDMRGLSHSLHYTEWHDLLVNEVLLPVAAGQKSAQDAVRAVEPRIDALLAAK